MNKPSTRTDIRASGVTKDGNHPDIREEPGTDDTEPNMEDLLEEMGEYTDENPPPVGFYDCGAETEAEQYSSEFDYHWSAKPGSDF